MPDLLHPDRLFPVQTEVRAITRQLYQSVAELPIISPHGHTDPSWFSSNQAFADPVSLLITPDHYLLRMFYSQGYALEDFGVGGKANPREVWRRFCENYYLFRGTPSRQWLDHALYEILGVEHVVDPENADVIYDHLVDILAQAEYTPRALFERFNIEVLATTESPLDDLKHHQAIRDSDWDGKVITAFRPDPVVDPDYEGFHDNIHQLAELTQLNTANYQGYLDALRQRREYFKQMGATSTDHGHPSAKTADLHPNEAAELYQRILNKKHTALDAEIFRAQMLTEMALMSLDDGLVMQIHPGSWRNHNKQLFKHYGRDMGADIPCHTDYVASLKPLLDKVGNERDLTIILFTLDETSYSRELAPLAGHYPCLKLGPAWWFHDSIEGIRRHRHQIIETAGFYNTVGFNDDTRAFISIPARHDMARRIDCGFLAKLVAEHRIRPEEAFELAYDLSYRLAKENYKLDAE